MIGKLYQCQYLGCNTTGYIFTKCYMGETGQNMQGISALIFIHAWGMYKYLNNSFN